MKYVRDRLSIRWVGYVVMPEHVHLLVLPERLAPVAGEKSVPHPALRNRMGHSAPASVPHPALRDGVGQPGVALNDGVVEYPGVELRDEGGRPPNSSGIEGCPIPCEAGMGDRLARDEPIPISTVLHDLKGVSGRWCKEALRGVWREGRTLGTKPLDAWATQEGDKPFWKSRGYDFNVIKMETMWEKLDYLHANPVRRGLVGHPRDWPWSSYRYYETGEGDLVATDWKGRMPMAV